MSVRPLMLVVLDGWGYNSKQESNAIALARTPVYTELMNKNPHTLLDASGEAVGLPEGQMGNSEVGHLNLGAGRVVYQDSTRISKAIREGDFFSNEILVQAMDRAKSSGKALHFMGLLSDGGVHSRMDHLIALLDMAKARGLTNIFFHAFLDGRDTPPASALGYVDQLEQHLQKIGIGSIASVSGRYYAMDRDKRWERVQKAYEALVNGDGIRKYSAQDAIRDSYEHGKTDEFVLPSVILDRRTNRPRAVMRDGDSVIFYNFRSDRAREITRTLTDPDFSDFKRRSFPNLGMFVCFTSYDETFGMPVAFPPQKLNNILGDVLSAQGIKQLRIAETEKYAHVTFFFNGGEEPPFLMEERVLIPSPRDVATYDLKPEMSAREITEELEKRIRSGQYAFILVNYANPDMVGHTGVLSAAVKAVEVLDDCLGRITRAAQEMNMVTIITADHGNLETMQDHSSGQAHTAHTTDPVPLLLIGYQAKLREGGYLADVAPTILQIMGIPQPEEMSGKSLII